jgi:hypothetical protein
MTSCQSSSAENVSCNVAPFFYHHTVVIQHLVSDTLYQSDRRLVNFKGKTRLYIRSCLLHEQTASQLVAIATRSDTGSHNRLDLIQSLVPTHYVYNGYLFLQSESLGVCYPCDILISVKVSPLPFFQS